MSWLCPHQLGELCRKVKKICEPGMKGCVLRGRAKFIEHGKGASEMNVGRAKGFGGGNKKSIGSLKKIRRSGNVKSA